MAEKKKIRVLHILTGMNHGGIQTFLISMLRTYDRHRFHMDILCTNSAEGPYTGQARGLGAKVLQCRMKYDQVRFIYKLYRFLRREKYDSINSHLADLGGGVLLAALLAKVPVRVASYHQMRHDMGFMKNFYLRIMRWFVVKAATNITTSSQAVSESYFTGNSAAYAMTQSISYGVDTEFFAKKPDNTLDLGRFGFSLDNMIVGHIGNYRPQKNHEALVKIAALAVNEVSNARFLLCGRPVVSSQESITGLYDRIAEQINELGLSKYFARVQDFDDIREFYDAIDIFVLPSREEGMPVSIIEAQAAGKPVVASRIGGIVIATAPEMRNNLFEVNDIDPFAQCLIDLLKDKEKTSNSGLAGQEFVRKNLDIRIAVRKYEELYVSQDNLSN
ncbi:MAG: glycosyltransferase [Planctomycetota bacterium]|jgi:glycosyltransferase involved in cell wall biosynthesis